jgi:hypothetical protein
MLIAIGGRAGGHQTHLACQVAEHFGPYEVFRYDATRWPGPTIDQVPFPAMAALAQRLAHPGAKGQELRVPDLQALRDGRPYLRGVDVKTFTEDTLEIARAAAAGELRIGAFVIDSLSRLYEQVLAEVLTAAVAGFGNAERAYPTAQAHASDAVTRFCWDLAQAAPVFIATFWDTDTMRNGKVSGTAPMLPKSALNQFAIRFRSDNPNHLEIEGSTLREVEIGDRIDPLTDGWDWLGKLRPTR